MPQDPEVSVQTLLGDAGAPPAVVWRGKTYTVGFNTQAAKARLERLVKAHVEAELYASEGATDAAVFARMEKRLQTLLDGDHYATLREGWFSVMKTPAGTRLFLAALLNAKHPELTPADAEAMAADEPRQTMSAIRTVAPGFFAQAAAAMRLPPDAVAKVVDIASRLFGGDTSTGSNGSSAP